MKEIRYWDSAALESHNSRPKLNESAKQFEQTQETFNQQMYELLMGTGNDPLFNSFDVSGDLFSLEDGIDEALSEKLGGIKNEGMEKVWAAKMQNVLPFSDWYFGYGDKQDNFSMGGLDNFIELTVKAEMARAKKGLQRLESQNRMSLQEYISKDEALSPKKEVTQAQSESPDEFVNNILEQIEAAAGKFDMSTDELLSKIKE